MRLLQLQNQYLYEGLDRESRNSVMLWESAGIKLREAQLTADQIQQLFAEIEKGATAGGANRTMLGKGKDAAVAVNKAWEDLKTKIQDSKPIKNVDAAFDQAVAKIEAGLGGPDNKVNQVIQKYRKFAKERPISQGLIYAALIAAAGISGAGLGGAAVLGLLKMTDKLLQGEKFSSAAYAGGKTGALAYGAGQIGQAMRGDTPAPSVSKDSETFGLSAEPNQAGNPDEWVKGNNPPPDWIKDPKTGKYFDPDWTTGNNPPPEWIKDPKTGKYFDPAGSPADTAKAVSAASADTSASSSAASSTASIKDQNAKAAWQMVQQKVDSGELTDPKAVSSELNKSLNKSFSDYGVNPNSPEAEASKTAAKEVLAKAKDPEELLGKMQSGEVRPAGPAPDTLKGADALKAADTAAGSGDATKAAAKGAKNAASELLQKYVGQEAPDGVIKNVAPNGSWIEYTSPTGRTFRETFPLEMNGKTYNNANQYLKAMFGSPTDVSSAPAADAGKAITKAATSAATDNVASSGDVGKAVKGAAGELMKYVGQEAPDGVIKNVAPNGKWIEYTSPAGRVVRDNFPMEMNGKTYTSAGPYLKALLGAPTESVSYTGKQLSEGQVYLVFNRVCAANDYLLAEGVLREGPMDFFKGAAAKGMQKLQGVGKNLTTKVTASKLNSAWQKAGAPTDSEELKTFLQNQGVDQTVVDTVYSSLKIKSQPVKTATSPDKTKTAVSPTTDVPAGAAQSAATQTLYAQLKKDVMSLNKKEKQRIFAYLQKQLGTV